MNNKNVKERIIEFIEFKQLNKNKFETMCGLSKRYVSNIVASISPEVMQRITLTFPDLNPAWLLTGEGEMLRPVPSNTIVTGDVSGDGYNFIAGNNNKVGNAIHSAEECDCCPPIEQTTVISPSIVRAPNYDIKQEFEHGEVGIIKPTQYIVPAHDIKAYTYCDDMEPEIRAGEPVLIKFMPVGCPITAGDMYFIDLPQGGKIRYIMGEEDDILHLRAANPAYADMYVPRSTVMSISQVMLIMRSPRSINNDATSLAQALERRDGQLDNLIQQIDKAGERESRLIEIIEKQYK